MIRNAAARRSPNCIMKTRKTRNTFCGTGYLSHCRNSAENCFPRKISLKSGNRLPSYDDFQYSRRPPSWIFLNVHFGHVTVMEFQICCCIPNFIKIGWVFVDIRPLNDFQDGTCPPCWVCEIWSLCYMTSIALPFCFPVQNLTEIGQSADEL